MLWSGEEKISKSDRLLGIHLISVGVTETPGKAGVPRGSRDHATRIGVLMRLGLAWNGHVSL